MSAPEKPPLSNLYERRDLNMRVVFIFLMILSFGALASVALTYGMHLLLLKYDKPPKVEISPLADYHQIPPEPRLQVDDAADLVDFRQSEDAILNSYGWLDAQKGKVRIPIDRAIDLIVERGLPVRKGGAAR